MDSKIVKIKVFEGKNPDLAGELIDQGKGFVYEDGYIVTANHILAGVREKQNHCQVELPDGTPVDAIHFDYSEVLDVAVLIVPKINERSRAQRFALRVSDLDPKTPLEARLPLEGKFVKGTVENVGEGSPNIQLTTLGIPPEVQEGSSGTPLFIQNSDEDIVLGVVTRQEGNIWTGTAISKLGAILPSPPEARNRRLKPMFRDYLIRHSLAIVVCIVLASIATIVLGRLSNVHTPIEWVGLAQCIFCVLGVFVSFVVWKRYPGIDADIRKRYTATHFDVQPALGSHEQFKAYWLALLFSWTALYGLITYRSRLLSLGPGVSIGLTFANNFGTLTMAVLYYVMQFISVESSDQTKTYRYSPVDGGSKLSAVFGLGSALLAGMTGLHIAAYYFWDRTGDCSKGFELASGALAGLVFASWIGKLDSKFIDANPSSLGLLYLYAVIQPLWPYVADLPGDSPLGNLLRPILLTVSLMLKIILGLFVFWIVGSGRLLFYFANVRRVYGRVAYEWMNIQLNPRMLVEKPFPIGLGAALVLVVVACYGGYWIHRGHGGISLDGCWSARITWTDSATASRLHPCPSYVYDPMKPPVSTGRLIIQNSFGKNPLMISVWTFAPTGTFDPHEGGNALVHVLPVLESPSGEDPKVTLRMYTVNRVFVRCSHEEHAKSQEVKRFQVDFRLVLEKDAEAGFLSGSMESLDSGTWRKVGTARFSKILPDDYNEKPPSYR